MVVGSKTDGTRQLITKSGFATKRDAEQAAQDLLSRDDTSIAATHGLTVADYLEQWLEGKRSIRATTRRSYESHIRIYLTPMLGSHRLADLRPNHVDSMYSRLIAAGQPSPTTLRRIHATLRSALNTAVKRRLLPWNPAHHIELPQSRRPATTAWTPNELGEFLTAIEHHDLYPLLRLVAVAGLRRGEALGLRWIDVDLEGGLIHIRQQLLDTGTELAFGPPKTRSGERSVPLDHATTSVLRALFEQQGVHRAAWAAAWVDSGLVFTCGDGSRMRPDVVTHQFKRLVASTGVRDIRFHDLRHTSASLALTAGVAMKTVSERLGHSSTTITADLYTHVAPIVARDAAQRIADAIPAPSRATEARDTPRYVNGTSNQAPGPSLERGL